MADAADGADGMFGTRHADHSRSCSAFAREGNLDAQRPQERLRPPQSAGRGVFGQPALVFQTSLPAKSAARKRSAALPVHELRSAIMSRTRAATGSASTMLSMAAR